MKRKEIDILKQIEEYIELTYSGNHYALKDDAEIQLIDYFESIGIAADFCRGCALKYLTRFGKKNGKNKKDLLKAIHYIIMLWQFCEDEFTETEE